MNSEQHLRLVEPQASPQRDQARDGITEAVDPGALINEVETLHSIQYAKAQLIANEAASIATIRRMLPANGPAPTKLGKFYLTYSGRMIFVNFKLA